MTAPAFLRSERRSDIFRIVSAASVELSVSRLRAAEEPSHTRPDAGAAADRLQPRLVDADAPLVIPPEVSDKRARQLQPLAQRARAVDPVGEAMEGPVEERLVVPQHGFLGRDSLRRHAIPV